MKKRTLPVLAVIAALSSAAFVACGEDHTHDYKWDSNADAHWQICECGDKTAEEAHFDVKNNETGADGADELCDACGRNLHVHNYTWHSNGDEHWEECACGDKHPAAPHVDEKNNADPNVAEADGKCDDCERNMHVVTFNVLGHGTAPAAQHVGEGGHVENPGDLEDDDSWKFKGWFKEEACTTPFNFASDTVSGATNIYAKWEDDDTAGASKKYAYALALSTENQQAAKLGESVYYKHTAEEAGRYTVALALGASANGTFTLDAAEGTFGLDCDADSVTIDLDAGQTVHILYTYKGESVDGITVSPLVSPVTDEPLPEGHFLAGEYISDNGNYLLEFNRTTKQIVYDGQNYTARYIGGKFDTLSFVNTVGQSANIFSIKHDGDGEYTLTIDTGTVKSSYALSYIVSQTPVALSAVAGYYEPANYTPGTNPPTGSELEPRPDADHGESTEEVGGTTGGITELYIYRSENANATSVRYKMLNQHDGGAYYSGLVDATYDTAKNRLTFGQYVVFLNLGANGEVEGITFGGHKYLRKGDAPAIPPAQLPLTDNTEYTGTTTVIRTEYGSQFFGATGYNGITVMDYDASTGMYTVAVNLGSQRFETYKLTVSNDHTTVALYNAEGTLVDTLRKYVWNIYDLPGRDQIPDQGAPDAIPADGFQKGLRLYRATEAGYYSFTIPEGAEGWRRLNLNDYTDSEYVVKIQSGDLVYLSEGELIAVYMQTPAAITVTVHCPDAPMGTSEDMPLVLENGMATLQTTSTQTYYFSYTAPAAGDYLVYVVYSSDSTNYNTILYSVNGTEYGYNSDTWEWAAGMSVEYPYASITVSDDNLTLGIQVGGSEYWDAITVYVSEIYTENANDLTLTGTPANNSLTVTATAATGANYHLASTKGESVTVTGSAAFTVKVQAGGVYDAVENGGVYTATIPAGKDVYFRLVSDTQQTLTLSQTYAKGTEGYPNSVTLNNGRGTYTVKTEAEYFTLAPGTYTVSAQSPAIAHYELGDDYAEINLYINYVDANSYYEYPEVNLPTYSWTITVGDGDVLYVLINCLAADENFEFQDIEFEFTKLEQLFEENQTGLYVGEDTEGNRVTLEFDVYGQGIYIPYMEYDVRIQQDDDGYIFTYGDDVAVRFTLTDGVMTLTAPDEYVGTITMEKEVPVGSAENPKVIVFDDGQAFENVNWDSELYISLPAGTYTLSYDVGGTITVWHNGSPLEAGGGQITVSEGDEIVLEGGFMGGLVTITAVE